MTNPEPEVKRFRSLDRACLDAGRSCELIRSEYRRLKKRLRANYRSRMMTTPSFISLIISCLSALGLDLGLVLAAIFFFLCLFNNYIRWRGGCHCGIWSRLGEDFRRFLLIGFHLRNSFRVLTSSLAWL